jgi:hypothetical protein
MIPIQIQGRLVVTGQPRGVLAVDFHFSESQEWVSPHADTNSGMKSSIPYSGGHCRRLRGQPCPLCATQHVEERGMQITAGDQTFLEQTWRWCGKVRHLSHFRYDLHWNARESLIPLWVDLWYRWRN